MPDYEREASRPNSRERGWNILATPGTYILLAINIAVFGWMVFHGVSAKDPTIPQLVHYGATNAGYIILGDRKSTRLNSSHLPTSRMPSSA